MSGQEGSDCLVVDQAAERWLRVKQSQCQNDPECHVCETIEEQFQERSADFCCWEDDPVGKVPDVVFLIFALEGEEGEVGWDEVADQAGHDGMSFEEGTEEEKHDEDDEKEDAGLNIEFFLDNFEGGYFIECLKLEWFYELV